MSEKQCELCGGSSGLIAAAPPDEPHRARHAQQEDCCREHRRRLDALEAKPKDDAVWRLVEAADELVSLFADDGFCHEPITPEIMAERVAKVRSALRDCEEGR